MTGPADWGKPEERPKLDLSAVTLAMAEAAFLRTPPAEVAAMIAKLRKATTQAQQQQAFIQVATEILSIVLKVAI